MLSLALSYYVNYVLLSDHDPHYKDYKGIQLCGWMELIHVQLGEMAQCLANMGQRLKQKRQDRVQMLNPNIPLDYGA